LIPENSTNMSVAGVLKWLCLIASIDPTIKAFQGIVLRRTAEVDQGDLFVPGHAATQAAAVKEGLLHLGVAAFFWLIAWALWYFWQRNED